MNKIKNFFNHVYFAVRYGEWDVGWDKSWLTKPEHQWFYCAHVYYDGHHWGLRVGKIFVGVSY